MLVFAAVMFDLGNTLVETPFHTEPIEKGSTEEIARFEAIVKVTYDSLVNSGTKISWSSFYEKYMLVRAEQIRVQKQTLREYSMKERIARTLSALEYKISADSELIRRAIEQHFDSYESYVEMNKEAPSTLQDLGARYRLGLITNFAYPPMIHKLLDKFHLRQFFDIVVISGEEGWVKPSPRIFQAAFSRLKLESSQCIFVGDDIEADIRGANNAGMKAIFLSNKGVGCQDAEASIRHLSELPSVLNEIEKKCDQTLGTSRHSELNCF
jgi:HAD superfamily hydrolase (TIGR01549 family)